MTEKPKEKRKPTEKPTEEKPPVVAEKPAEAPAEKPKEKEKKPAKVRKKEKKAYTRYKIDDKGLTLTRLRPYCERCGPGYFMADHGDRYSCGHCGFTRYKRA